MNTTTTFRSLLLISLFLLLGNAYSWAETPASEKKKEVNQSFAVSASDQLRVENMYGNITIVHWDKNEVAIRVVIEAKASSDSRAQEIIDRVTISMNKSGNTVSAVTSLKSNNNKSGNNESWSINYFVTMPSSLTTSLSQKYGNINMPDKNNGKCQIEVQYGSFKAGSFTAPFNIEARYSNVEMKDMTTGELDLAYSNTVIGNATTANIESRYSNLKMQNVNTLSLETSYGELKAERIGKADLELRYNNGIIQAVESELNVDLAYCTLDVNNLSASFSAVNAEASYGNLNLGIPANTGFTVVAEDMKYGNVSIDHTSQMRKEGNTIHATVNNGGKQISFDGGSYSNLKIKSR